MKAPGPRIYTLDLINHKFDKNWPMGSLDYGLNSKNFTHTELTQIFCPVFIPPIPMIFKIQYK